MTVSNVAVCSTSTLNEIGVSACRVLPTDTIDRIKMKFVEEFSFFFSFFSLFFSPFSFSSLLFLVHRDDTVEECYRLNATTTGSDAVSN